MVWWGGSARADAIKNARTETLDCDHCGNRTEHALHRAKSGAGFGNPITGKMWVSTRSEWMLMCPVCEMALMITKEDAKRLQEPAVRQSAPTGAPSSQKTCPSCNEVVNATARFCGSCGRENT